jgi:OmpR-family two-component system manganese-sensing sensor histidine kinase
LGLAIAQAITQTHRGQIQVSSQLGKGTTFTVIFPQMGV